MEIVKWRSNFARLRRLNFELMYVIILSFLTAFTLTYFAIPSIIHVAEAKNLFDEPNRRSSHTRRTPSLGGIGIFAGAIFSIVLWTPFDDFGDLQYILCALLILFLIGVKDDIMPMSPYKKITAQVLAAAILFFKSDIQLKGFYGLFGFTQDIWFPLSLLLSIFTILVIINAFNLIDGINALAGSIGVVVASTMGCWFFLIDRVELAIVAFTTVGAVLAFLKYNFTPARIFMGDAGSLLIGLISAFLMIEFIDASYSLPSGHAYKLQNIPAVGFGVMIIPLFDTLRVFSTRIFRRQSPFKADRRHIHHLLIDSGLSHLQATGVLVGINIGFIILVFSLHDRLDLHPLLLLILVLASVMTYFLHKRAVRTRNKNQFMAS